MAKRTWTPLLERMDEEILAAGVPANPFQVGERLLRFAVEGGAEALTLAANPSPGSIEATVTRGDGSQVAVRVPYLFRDDALTQRYIAAEVEYRKAVHAWVDAVQALDPEGGREARLAARPHRDRVAPLRNAATELFMRPEMHPYPYPYRAYYQHPRTGRSLRSARPRTRP